MTPEDLPDSRRIAEILAQATEATIEELRGLDPALFQAIAADAVRLAIMRADGAHTAAGALAQHLEAQVALVAATEALKVSSRAKEVIEQVVGIATEVLVGLLKAA